MENEKNYFYIIKEDNKWIKVKKIGKNQDYRCIHKKHKLVINELLKNEDLDIYYLTDNFHQLYPNQWIKVTFDLLEIYRESMTLSLINSEDKNYLVKDAIKDCFFRYLNFKLKKKTKKLCEVGILEINKLPIDKLSRWLGYIQYEVINSKKTTIKRERNVTREYFHHAYKNENIEIPKSIKV